MAGSATNWFKAGATATAKGRAIYLTRAQQQQLGGRAAAQQALNGGGAVRNPVIAMHSPPAGVAKAKQSTVPGGSHVIGFGKHKGLTVAQVAQKDPGYFTWMQQQIGTNTRPGSAQAQAMAAIGQYQAATSGAAPAPPPAPAPAPAPVAATPAPAPAAAPSRGSIPPKGQTMQFTSFSGFPSQGPVRYVASSGSHGVVKTSAGYVVVDSTGKALSLTYSTLRMATANADARAARAATPAPASAPAPAPAPASAPSPAPAPAAAAPTTPATPPPSITGKSAIGSSVSYGTRDQHQGKIVAQSASGSHAVVMNNATGYYQVVDTSTGKRVGAEVKTFAGAQRALAKTAPPASDGAPAPASAALAPAAPAPAARRPGLSPSGVAYQHADGTAGSVAKASGAPTRVQQVGGKIMFEGRVHDAQDSIGDYAVISTKGGFVVLDVPAGQTLSKFATLKEAQGGMLRKATSTTSSVAQHLDAQGRATKTIKPGRLPHPASEQNTLEDLLSVTGKNLPGAARHGTSNSSQASAGGERGDAFLSAIQQAHGWDVLPQKVSQRQLDQMLASGEVSNVLYRGARGFEKAYIDGPLFSSGSNGRMYGAGTYTASSGGKGEPHAGSALSYVSGYGSRGSLLRMGLRKSAKTISATSAQSKRDAWVQQETNLLRTKANNGQLNAQQVQERQNVLNLMGSDYGYWAAAMGYDAITASYSGFQGVIVLNRSATIVQDTLY